MHYIVNTKRLQLISNYQAGPLIFSCDLVVYIRLLVIVDYGEF